MKRKFTSVLAVAIATASLPLTVFAADDSDPVTKNGERLKYNTSYYLKDKHLPHKGGVTFESWILDDFVRFADSSIDNGTPIIFENKDNTDGWLKSGDEIRVKSTNVTFKSKYWTVDTIFNSIYLNYDTTTDLKIFGSSTDNSIGIGLSVISLTATQAVKGFKGEHTEKAWIKVDKSLSIKLEDIQTPFEVIEVSE
ncbi:hypothetical protein BT246_69990 (plasmid) [Bacillus thuringiensis]|uniref:Uncharacterized protein n=1 Tax=Bacillus thuringiensis TaxID=1428 RepID=A0A9W3X4D8_BACTU|nr:hypothetical protein [Bacillus thuringiensis]ANS52290.1 hypothetical protein BT246_69990 [Bacillus thuringiensis]